MIPARGALPNPRSDAIAVIAEPSAVIALADVDRLLQQPEMVQLRRRVRGDDLRLHRALVALALAVLQHRAMSPSGQIQAPHAVTDRPSTWLTTREAAERLGVSPRTVRRLIGAGLLHADRPGYGHLLDAEEVEALRTRRDAA